MTTLVQARTELQARGYSRFLPARLTTWLNDAKDQFEDVQYDWPWLLATTSGTSPLTISDLRRVLSVADSTNRRPLSPATRSQVIEFANTDLTLAGPPDVWYRTSDTVLATYPTSGASLSVGYVKFSPALSADADTPLIPSRYHGTWVDLAESHVLRYGVKDQASAAVLEQAALVRVRQVAGVYAMQDRPEVDVSVTSWESCDA